MKFYSNSPEETQALGSRMGALANKGELFLLSGELGSGKTTFVQGFAWGAGVEGYAHSTTFKLVNQYQQAGRYNVLWKGDDLFGNPVSSGIYFYQIRSSSFIQTRKMVLSR